MRPAQKVLTTILWGLTVLIMVSVIGAGLWRRSEASQLSVLADAPQFSLIDQNAQPVTLATLRGKPWIADFVFTHCAGPCPIMTGKMATLQKTIAAPDLQFVTFSVDPENDTPAALKAYAARFAADESRWKFLTGEKDTIFATARGMLVTAIPANDKSPIIHSEKFILVDADGKIRRYYDSTDEQDMTALKQDAAALADEAAATR